jgi:inorganic triphosphatase YgiF
MTRISAAWLAETARHKEITAKVMERIFPLIIVVMRQANAAFARLARPRNQSRETASRPFVRTPGGQMAREVELKFEVPPGMLRMLNSRLQRLTHEPAKHDRLVSVYFDTTKGALRDQGLSLRVRRIGEHYVQTIKCAGGAAYRQEWEEEVPGAKPDRRLARHTALTKYATRKKWRKLRPIFETAVNRASYPVKCGNSLIEVAIDHGKVKAGQDSKTISEIELELKKGEVADLARLAGRIAGAKHVSLGLRSKAERGYALADDEADGHVRASPVVLDAESSAAEGFRGIALSCLHQVAANREAVLNDDPEGVHQMRVGLRRLRAALSLFKPMLDGGGLEKVKKDLKWLCDASKDSFAPSGW